MLPRLRQRWHSCFAIFVVTALMAGCTMVYPFEMTGVIRNAVDGSPMTGVLIEPEPRVSVKGYSPIVTGADGQFSFEFGVDTFQFSKGKLPTWSFKLSKEGFDDELLEITPTQKSRQSKINTQIMLFAFVRPTPPAAQPQQIPVDAPQNVP